MLIVCMHAVCKETKSDIALMKRHPLEDAWREYKAVSTVMIVDVIFIIENVWGKILLELSNNLYFP